MKLTSVWPSTAAHYCAVKTANVDDGQHGRWPTATGQTANVSANCKKRHYSCGNRATATTTITTAYTTGYPTAYMTANLT